MTISFFSNAGTLGSAVPFQRTVEPGKLGMYLNLEQAELLRIERYNEAWRFYFGKHWMFRREDGEPLVTVNYYRKIIDKIATFLVGKGFVTRVPEALEEITLPFLEEVWEYNKGQQFAWDTSLMGGITGDAFALITFEEATPIQRQVNPYSRGNIRVQLLGSEQVFPTWDPMNQDVLLAARIETVFYADGMLGSPTVPGGSQAGRQLQTKRFSQIITPSQIIEQAHGSMPIFRPNLLGEIALVHIKNMGVPKEYYGLPDGQDIIDLQREYNEKSTDISDIINYHASPTTVIFGAKAKQLDKGPKQIWSGLPADARVETIGLNVPLGDSNTYLDKVKTNIHALSDVPEGTLGALQPISNTSGVALHMQFQPLIERRMRKADQYQPGFEQINYFILRIGVVTGMLNLPYDICKHCGGRIVDIEVPNKTRKVWDPMAIGPTGEPGMYVDVPLTTKKCYEIDPATLDFMEPEEMRIKFWREYGFGSEVREAPLSQIERELKLQKKSFWDYGEIQKQVQEKYRKENPPPPAAEPPKPSTDPEVVKAKEMADATRDPAPTPPPPLVHPDDDQTDLPDAVKMKPLPPQDIDIPEEPENVEVTQKWVHPQTQQVILVEPVVRSLVPTGCRRPQYLNPYKTTVEFLDPMPKDEALQAVLYRQYQDAGWVDAEWCRERIPAIAESKTEIERRIKKNGPLAVSPASGDPSGGGANANTGGANADPRQMTKVPGKGGNPVNPGQQ